MRLAQKTRRPIPNSCAIPVSLELQRFEIAAQPGDLSALHARRAGITEESVRGVASDISC
jgi:hypothetical protein